LKRKKKIFVLCFFPLSLFCIFFFFSDLFDPFSSMLRIRFLFGFLERVGTTSMLTICLNWPIYLLQLCFFFFFFSLFCFFERQLAVYHAGNLPHRVKANQDVSIYLRAIVGNNETVSFPFSNDDGDDRIEW